jgi:hypothetical protein
LRLSAPRLARIRSFFSIDGQFAEFYILNKKGASLSFTIPFAELGLLMAAFQKAARQMGERLNANGHASAAQVAEGLANAAPVTAVAMGKDADSGDALLWLETTEAGPLSVRLTSEMLPELRRVIDQHERECEDRLAAE